MAPVSRAAARSEPPGGERAGDSRPDGYVGAVLEFGPARYVHEFGFTAGETPSSPKLRAALAPRASLGAPGRLSAIVDETPDRLSARLRGELPRRLDAASRWIAYSLHSLANSSTVPVEVPEVLRAPLPDRR